jgi:fido (protein-threonine AMPylation protein)
VPGPNWSDDDPSDLALIAANCQTVLRDAALRAGVREMLTADRLREWHRLIYQGCRVPSTAYVGNFRGDTTQTDLVGYEVGIGRLQTDGYPECVGVWSHEVVVSVAQFFMGLSAALALLDNAIIPGQPPATTQLLEEVAEVCAYAHGEWVRIHPFANGNGRTARIIANAVALRYALPAFITLKPRPSDVLYVRAAKSSMGRPPDFRGDHAETIAVFCHYLRMSYTQP